MNQLYPNENRLEGSWRKIDGMVIADETCRRIDELVSSVLAKIAATEDGWDTLFLDIGDGRRWELTYPYKEWHGGGPPTLTHVSDRYALEKFGGAAASEQRDDSVSD